MFRDLVRLQQRVNRLFDETFPQTRSQQEDIFLQGEWYPAVDVWEDEDAIKLKADLPDVDSKDIQISVENNVLFLKGERKFEKETKEENFYRMERSYGSFHRSFALPRTIDPDRIKAEYRNGVLYLAMPKREETKPRRIQISGESGKTTHFEPKKAKEEEELVGAKK